jgi:hypothetical protein
MSDMSDQKALGYFDGHDFWLVIISARLREILLLSHRKSLYPAGQARARGALVVAELNRYLPCVALF